MAHRVGRKGRVVIPKELRDELGIEPGDEVVFWKEGDHLALRAAPGRKPLRGRFKGAPWGRSSMRSAPQTVRGSDHGRPRPLGDHPRYLDDDQRAAAHVEALLAVERPIVSWINLGEVFSVVRRRVT